MADLRKKALSRRDVLRTSLLGGVGLTGAYLLGCGDGGDSAEPTPAPGETQIRPTQTLPPPYGTGELDLTWEQLQPAGVLPSPRKDHSLALRESAEGGQIYLFAGRDTTGDLSDFWMYDIASATWTELAPTGPSARHGHNAVWDFVNDRMLVFGGQQGSAFFNDLWQYTPDDERWAELAPAGPLPEARYGAGAAMSTLVSGDTSGTFLPGHFIVTHGFTAAGRFDDTWAFDVATDTWTDVSPSDVRPIERCLIRGAWDTLRNRLVIFGGQTNDEPFLGDMWTLSGSRDWTEVLRVPQPGARTFYSMATDPARNNIVLVGGNTAEGPSGEVWIFHIQDEFWTQGAPSDQPPPARFGHDAVWVPASSSMLMFGGEVDGSDTNELWQLTMADA